MSHSPSLVASGIRSAISNDLAREGEPDPCLGRVLSTLNLLLPVMGSAHQMVWRRLLAPSAWAQPPAPFAFCSSAICARAASTSSALVLACPARPHPPSIASVRSTQVLAVSEGSPAAAATRSVN